MKRINILLTILIAMALLVSCEDDPFGPVVSVFTSPAFSAPTGGTAFVLTEETENDVMTTFTWSAADFGYQAEVRYIIQMAEAGDDFGTPIDVLQTTTESAPVTVGFINNLMLSNDFPFDIVTDMEFRILAAIHEDVDTLTSGAVALSITPFEKIIIYPRLFVPGEHNGWNEADSTSSIFSIKSNDKYEGYIYTTVAPSGFKLLKVPAWEEANTIGDPDASGTTETLQIGSWGGNNINIQSGPGYHRIKADLVALTYSILLTDWGLIGDATPGGWDSDTNMTYDVGTDIWSVTLDLVVGKIKFRANDDWTLNYGSNNANGICDEGGPDIPIAEAGNYTVTLDLSDALYRYTVTKN